MDMKEYYNQSGYLWHSVYKDPTPKTKHFRYVDKYNTDSEVAGYIANVMTINQYCKKYEWEGEELEEGMKGSIQFMFEEEETEKEMILIEYTQYHKVNKFGKLRRFCNSCYSIDCGQTGSYEVCTGSWHTEDIYIYSTKNEALEELNRDRDIILNYDEAIKKLASIKI